MKTEEIEKELLRIICTKRDVKTEFNKELITIFEDYFETITNKKQLKNINDYYAKGKAQDNARKVLLKNKELKQGCLTEEYGKDFKGIYVFYHNDEPFYVGRSKHVLQRINEHVKAVSKQISSLAYHIGFILNMIENEEKYICNKTYDKGLTFGEKEYKNNYRDKCNQVMLNTFGTY